MERGASRLSVRETAVESVPPRFMSLSAIKPGADRELPY